MSSKLAGTVKWFNTEKGYGFINGPDGDVFVHYRSISPGEDGFKNLDEGDEVEFTQVQSEKPGHARTAHAQLPSIRLVWLADLPCPSSPARPTRSPGSCAR